MAHRSLLVLPDDTVAPLLQAINGARESLRIKMFVFTDPTLLAAVLEAAARGVAVQVMLNHNRSNGEEPNESTKERLLAAGVAVRDSHPVFKVTHEKSMVVDDHTAFIQSLNWAAHHLTGTRDLAIATTHRKEVQEIAACFDSDWSRTVFNPGDTAHLIWCNGNGRARLAHFIDQARHSLFIMNDRYQDMVILERLIKAAGRGVKVHLLSPPPHALKKEKIVEGVGGLRLLHDVGVKVHHIQHLALHAKMLLRDEAVAIIGSINLTTGSFDERRELAIEVDEAGIIDRLVKMARHDWHHSLPIDLSDKGLYEDLENRGGGGTEKLVLHLGKKDQR